MTETRYFRDMINTDEIIAELKGNGLVIVAHEVDMILAEGFRYLGQPETPIDRVLFGYMMGLETVVAKVLHSFYNEGSTLTPTDIRALILFHGARGTERFQKAVLAEKAMEPWLFETKPEDDPR
jgi:hypothetical protein